MPHMGASYDLLPFENSASNPYGLSIPGDSCGTSGREDRGYSGLGETDQRQKLFTMPVPENLLRKFLKSRELTQSPFLKKLIVFQKYSSLVRFGLGWSNLSQESSLSWHSRSSIFSRKLTDGALSLPWFSVSCPFRYGGHMDHTPSLGLHLSDS